MLRLDACGQLIPCRRMWHAQRTWPAAQPWTAITAHQSLSGRGRGPGRRRSRRSARVVPAPVRVHPVGGVVGPVTPARERVDRAQATAVAPEQVALVEVAVDEPRWRGVLAEALHGRSRPGELRAGARVPRALRGRACFGRHRREAAAGGPSLRCSCGRSTATCSALASVAATPGTMRSSRSAPRSSSASRSRGAGPPPQRAEADGLVGRPVPGAGELQHRVRAVLPADGADRCEETTAELRPELEPPALGERGSRVLGARPATLAHRRPRAG